jgi:hypothetical protein
LLSAEEAYSDYSHGQKIPAGTIAQYGTVTLAGNRANAWAFSSNEACWPGYGMSPLPTPPDGYCTTWTFVDPGSGTELEQTQQG